MGTAFAFIQAHSVASGHVFLSIIAQGAHQSATDSTMSSFCSAAAFATPSSNVRSAANGLATFLAAAAGAAPPSRGRGGTRAGGFRGGGADLFEVAPARGEGAEVATA